MSSKETVINQSLNLLDGFVFKRTGDTGSGNFIFSHVPDANANYGVVSIGSGGFAGGGGTNFAGSASGTGLAINTAAGFGGNLVDGQVGGVSRFSWSNTGTLTITAGSGSRCMTLTHGSGAGSTIFMNPAAGGANLRTNIRFSNYQFGTDSGNNLTNDLWWQNLNSGNLFLTCNSTDLVTIGTTNASGGAVLGKSGGKIGFFDATPVVKVAAYTVTNHVASRTLNESTVTLAQLANIVGTLLLDAQGYGLVG